jgi:fructose-1,6-bisphosphatase/inositol monophosphatase family enzyme/predicted metal-dependent phosphoesterase TrpH
MSIMDLHIHSNFSDGSMSVEDIFKEANRKHISTISITDHDTLDNICEIQRCSKLYNVNYILGIEISAYDYINYRKVHLLAYGYNPNCTNIQEICDPILMQRDLNTRKQILILKENGYKIDISEVEAIAGENRCLYKQHIMQVLIKKGYTDSIYSDLYKKLFKGNGICNFDIEYVDVNNAIEAVTRDGWYPVLAHPGTLGDLEIINPLAQRGLWGLEYHHEENDIKIKKQLKKYSESLGLKLTGGSDTHGSLGSLHSLGEIIAPHDLQLPKNINGNKRLELGKEIVKIAGNALLGITVGKTEQDIKENNYKDIVTTFDLLTEKTIVDYLKKEFPEDNFVTEEEDRGVCELKGYTWILDPIDGTTNFVCQQENYGISLGCYLEGSPVFGIVYDVKKRDLFIGINGEGAWLNNNRLQPLNPEKSITQALGDFSLHTIVTLEKKYGVDFSLIDNAILGHRSLGAASIIICNIARGITDFYLSSKLKIWDYSAACILLNEVGGMYRVHIDKSRENSIRQRRIFLACSSQNILDYMEEHLRDKGVSLEVENKIMNKNCYEVAF